MATKRTTFTQLTAEPVTERGRVAYDDEARISEFREFVFRLRTEAGLTQTELALRMGTTQSAIARMEGGGTRPILDTLEKLATAVGSELVVGVAPGLSENRSIAKLVREGHAVLRSANCSRSGRLLRAVVSSREFRRDFRPDPVGRANPKVAGFKSCPRHQLNQ